MSAALDRIALDELRDQVSRMRDERDALKTQHAEMQQQLNQAHSDTRREAMWARHFQRAARLQAHRTWKQRVRARNAETAVQRVRDVHAPELVQGELWCPEDDERHPCTTWRAIDGSKTTETEQPTEETRGWGYCPCGRLLHPEQVTCDKCGEECP